MFIVLSRRHLGGQNLPSQWGGIGRLGEERDVVTVEVNNVLTEKKIHNVFGVIKGIVDPGMMQKLRPVKRLEEE